MAVFDIYSKRQKILRGEVPDVYVYNDIPNPLRVQIVHIIRDAIGESNHRSIEDKPRQVYSLMHDTLCREYGVFSLSQNRNESMEESILSFLLQTKDFEKAIDVIDLCFKYIDKVIDPEFDTYTFVTTIRMEPKDAIEELNARFKEHGIGFQFEGGEIIRIDSTYAHSEIVKPTLNLLSNRKFHGALEEYLKAHEHYRHGRNKECLTECLKAYESTMKIICKEKNWPFNVTDTSKKLINICLQNNLVPPFTQNQFTCLISLLESGIPTIRNKLSGHGQGQIPQKVDDEMTRYALNLTGTNIIFLIEQSDI
jgi:hypothetical protein